MKTPMKVPKNKVESIVYKEKKPPKAIERLTVDNH